MLHLHSWLHRGPLTLMSVNADQLEQQKGESRHHRFKEEEEEGSFIKVVLWVAVTEIKSSLLLNNGVKN